MEYVSCERCGFVMEYRKRTKLCSDCRARKTSKIDDCIAWQGDFAGDLITPINEFGEPVFTGIRTCPNADCVQPEHWINEPTED